MKPRSCNTSHFIWSIKDGVVKKVLNVDSYGRPALTFKKLEDIIRSIDAHDALKFEDDYVCAEIVDNGAQDKQRCLPLADRKTRARDTCIVKDEEQECLSDENCSEQMTLAQLKKKCRTKKRKASHPVLLTPKTEDGDSDLNEPLCKWRVKVLKSSDSKVTPVKESVPISSRSTLCVGSGPIMTDVSLVCNERVDFGASSSGDKVVNHELKSGKSGSFTNEEQICGFGEVSLENLDCNESTSLVLQIGVENMELGDEKNMSKSLVFPVSKVDNDEYFNHLPSIVSSSDVVSPAEEQTMGPCNSPQSDPYLQKVPGQVNHVSGVQDSDSVAFQDDSIHKKELPLVSEKGELEINFSDHNYQTDITSEGHEMRNFHCTELGHSERLPSTRKVISPTSQENLCLAMNSAELLDDTEHYKCNEKLYFGEQPENEPSPNRSEDEGNERNVQPQQNKVTASSKQILTKSKNIQKGSPPKRRLLSKSCLDGPRLCRSLPGFSTGCTSIQGCSENAIAFSQRQMHDIESLASKLMAELNSMRVIAEEKLLYEAYRSTSLKNEAAEVKSAIKTATKTEKTARKWLSMMTRDCNRFCKIMKLNKDDKSAASGSEINENPLQKERKRISFADEAGGKLCDVKVFENQESSLAQ